MTTSLPCFWRTAKQRSYLRNEQEPPPERSAKSRLVSFRDFAVVHAFGMRPFGIPKCLDRKEAAFRQGGLSIPLPLCVPANAVDAPRAL